MHPRFYGGLSRVARRGSPPCRIYASKSPVPWEMAHFQLGGGPLRGPTLLAETERASHRAGIFGGPRPHLQLRRASPKGPLRALRGPLPSKGPAGPEVPSNPIEGPSGPRGLRANVGKDIVGSHREGPHGMPVPCARRRYDRPTARSALLARFACQGCGPDIGGRTAYVHRHGMRPLAM